MTLEDSKIICKYHPLHHESPHWMKNRPISVLVALETLLLFSSSTFTETYDHDSLCFLSANMRNCYFVMISWAILSTTLLQTSRHCTHSAVIEWRHSSGPLHVVKQSNVTWTTFHHFPAKLFLDCNMTVWKGSLVQGSWQFREVDTLHMLPNAVQLLGNFVMHTIYSYNRPVNPKSLAMSLH